MGIEIHETRYQNQKLLAQLEKSTSSEFVEQFKKDLLIGFKHEMPEL